MALVAPPQVTDAPARVAAPFGLFSVVTPAPVGSVRWENGVTWTDEQCGALPDVIVPDCSDPAGVPLTFVQGQSTGLAKAFTVMGDFLCSPTSWTPERAQDAATQRLLAREEEAAGVQILKFLTSDASIEGASLATTGNISSDVALLEMTLAEDYGSQGLIFLSLKAAYALSTGFNVKQVGKTLQTLMGTPIAVVRTIPSAIPTFSAGIVPMPLVTRGDPFTSTDGPASAALLNRAQNDLYAAAFRTYVAGWTIGCGASFISL